MAQAIEQSTTVSTISDAFRQGDVDGALEAAGPHRRKFLAAAALAVPAAAAASSRAVAAAQPDA